MSPSGKPDETAFFAPLVAFAREFLAYAGRTGLVAALLIFAGALLEGVGLLLIVPLLGVVTGDVPGRLHEAVTLTLGFTGAHTAFGRLAALLAFFSVLMIVRAVVLRARDVMLSRLQAGFVETVRLGIVRRLAAARWDQVVGLRHARITHLMSGDVQRIGLIAHFALQSATAVTMLVVQAGLALFLAPGLALMAFVLLAATAAAMIPVIRRTRQLGTYVTTANLSLMDTAAQLLGGLKLAVSQDLQGGFVDEFRTTLRSLTERQVDNSRQQSNVRVALTTLAALMGVVLVLVGFGWFALPAPVLITLLLVIARMSGPSGQIQQGLQQIAFALPAYEHVKALEQSLASVAVPVPMAAQMLPEGPVEFDHVRFLHETGPDETMRGVRDLTLTIQPGEMLGIAGSSGAGKTTFADLLVGLFSPQSGRITVGGMPLEGGVLQGWRARLAYVSQDPFLFHDCVRGNLAWARPGVSEEEMWQALRLADAEALVRRIGLDTVVGERGTLISGGERQRIALARALLRQPSLLVLDEATNAIDIAGEKQILARLRALEPRPTIVLIAHRRESLSYCDRMLDFAEGGIIASHAEGTGAGL